MTDLYHFISIYQGTRFRESLTSARPFTFFAAIWLVILASLINSTMVARHCFAHQQMLALYTTEIDTRGGGLELHVMRAFLG